MDFIIYHQVDNQNGVLLDGHTVFIGDRQSCLDYVTLFMNETTDTLYIEETD